MKKFSVTAYYLKFLLYILISFALSLSVGTIVGLLVGGYGLLVGFFLAVIIFPWGLWNFFFFFKALPQEQALRPKVWLGSILLLPLMLLALFSLFLGGIVYTISLKNFFIFLACLFSNSLVYFLTYTIKVARSKREHDIVVEG